MRRKFRFAKKTKQDFVKDFRANDKIRVQEVFLIDESGEKIGVMSTEKALDMARAAELDLVEVNPKAEPPIVKILDLGQFKYEQSKKIHKQKVLQKKVELKNIRLSFRISKHDLDVRVEQAFKFLSKSNKVKIEMILRGREKQHFDKAKEIMLGFVDSLRAKPEIEVFEEQLLTKQPGGYTMILTNKK